MCGCAHLSNEANLQINRITCTEARKSEDHLAGIRSWGWWWFGQSTATSHNNISSGWKYLAEKGEASQNKLQQTPRTLNEWMAPTKLRAANTQVQRAARTNSLSIIWTTKLERHTLSSKYPWLTLMHLFHKLNYKSVVRSSVAERTYEMYYTLITRTKLSTLSQQKM